MWLFYSVMNAYNFTKIKWFQTFGSAWVGAIKQVKVSSEVFNFAVK